MYSGNSVSLLKKVFITAFDMVIHGIFVVRLARYRLAKQYDKLSGISVGPSSSGVCDQMYKV